MLEGKYRAYLNLIALKQVIKPVYIPDVKLCIGEAENLQSVPVMVLKSAMPKPKTAQTIQPAYLPYEKFGKNFTGDVLKPEDFYNDGFNLDI